MKNAFLKKLMALILIGVMVLGVVACGSDKKDADTEDKDSAEESEVVLDEDDAEDAEDADAEDADAEDADADEEDAEVDAEATEDTVVTSETPLVIGTYTLDGKFTEFFATSAYDRDIADVMSLFLLWSDENGEPVANADVPSYALDYTMDVADDQSETTYTFALKNDLVFSDGTPVTIDDLLFSMYVYSDPYYDGSSTFYSLDIEGMDEYRLQTSTEMVEVGDDILEAGISGEGDADPVLGDGLTVATPEQQAAFWSYLDEAGVNFAQEIVDYVMANYLEAYAGDILPDNSTDEIADSEALSAAFAMSLWGFGGVEDSTFTDANDVEYDLSDDAVELNAETFWNNLKVAYGYDLSDEGINGEKAGDKSVEDYVKELFYQNEGAVEGGVSEITGITKTTATVDGEEYDAIEVKLNGIDPVAIFRMGVDIAPKAYYLEGFDGEVNEFGVNPANRDLIEHLKTKNDKPMGAGPYIFESYKDNIVTLTANDNYIMGSPKIKTLRYQVIESGSEMDALKTGQIHFAEPSAKTETVSDISSGEGDFAKLDYTLVDNDGYGYIGMNAQAIPEWKIRQALAHAMNPQLSVDNYYGELASVNYRTMTKVQWAYPDNPEPIYAYDETGETSKALFLEEGYVYDEAANEMQYPEGHEKAGEQVTFTFTMPMAAEEHPAGSIFLNTQEILEQIGVKVDIEEDPNLLGKLTTAYESGIQVWTAAWGSGGVDPDMFQIWYSDPAVNQAGSPEGMGLYWLYENGTDDQKAVLVELNENITAGRSSLDPEERKPIYAKALELSTSLATEVPTYQRKNMFAFNKDVIDADTMFSGDQVTPFQSPLKEIWNVELNVEE
ncbi:MAG: ABC transporter substrate-binding protein [Bacillota bacterium]|nr:ABC transporter substrate-binding protein [Bacillota bacterium]